MYAVIATGGKQYRVAPGDVIEVEYLSAGDEDLVFPPLLVATDDGQTLVGAAAAGYPVAGKLLGEAKGDKIIVFKYRNKTGYTAKTGHRQLHSVVEITSIGATEPAAEPAPAAAEG